MQRPEYRTGRHERAVKVYTVCDESRFLIVRNVPALGCVDELVKLFGLYGDIEEYRLLDEEDCEPFTDVYWIKYVKISSSRFAKRKLDDYRFLGSALQVSYATQFETLTDTKSKLEERRRTVLNRIQANQRTSERPLRAHPTVSHLEQLPPAFPLGYPSGAQQYPPSPLELLPRTSGGQSVDLPDSLQVPTPVQRGALTRQHFPLASMNATVQSVREKLNKISDIHVAPPAAPRETSEDERKQHEAKGKRRIEGDNLQVTRKQREGNRRRI